MPSPLWQLLQLPCSDTYHHTPADVCIINVLGKREENSCVTASCGTEFLMFQER